MTYIIGAKCSDGVAIIGDKKITIGDGTEYSYADKIFSPLNNVVVGASGSTGLFRTFQSRLVLAVQEAEREGEKAGHEINWLDEFILLTERVIRQMLDEYGEIMANNFDALVAFRFAYEPLLFNFNYLGMPQPVTSYKAIGHGEPYGSILLNTIWKNNKPMTTSKFAKLGCAIIKYVQDFELDNSVGFDSDDNELPQVWYLRTVPEDLVATAKSDDQLQQIYDNYAIREIKKTDTKTILNEIEPHIQTIKDTFESFKL